MPPRPRLIRRNNDTPPPPPPPQFDPVMFQVAVIATVTASMAQVNAGGAGGGTDPQRQDGSQGKQKECSYKDFMTTKPKSFNGNGGVIALTRWLEKIECIYEICACSKATKEKFAACTFIDRALTWWNGQVKTLTLPVANARGWERLKELMPAEYCRRGVVQKLEHELWNLKMKGSDIAAYTANEVVTVFEAQKESGGKKKKAWNKRKGQSSQEPSKKQQTVVVHVVPTTQTPTIVYARKLPLCNKCDFHHHGPCRELSCNSCGKKGHTARYCKVAAQPTNQTAGAGAG
ncbi:uncharacterized protein LOC111916968 [Lactuca sativa]|uniref:uncharacterized protein LOC111916968 n=1 Tax=Lactuca sativa TaxID=4236 RepID=UPI000CD8C22A|nr:uncharacterized protein LOC111916968 [Lactuca sativa]